MFSFCKIIFIETTTYIKNCIFILYTLQFLGIDNDIS